MSLAIKEKCASVREKLVVSLKKRFTAPGWALPALRKHARDHLSSLGKRPAWQFILMAGLWLVVFKVALLPVGAFVSGLVFGPLKIDTLFATAPVFKITDSLTRILYIASPVGWASTSVLTQILLLAVLFPAVSTVLAQFLPLEVLPGFVPSKARRVRISLTVSLVVMGILSVLCWGQLSLLVTGALAGLPLAYTYFHWRRRLSTTGACLVTGGVNATANAVIILMGFFGGIQ